MFYGTGPFRTTLTISDDSARAFAYSYCYSVLHIDSEVPAAC